MKRREFAKMLSLGALLRWLPAVEAADADAPTLPRQDIRTFSSNPVNVDKLRRATEQLQQRGLDDMTAWFNMAAIHDIFHDDPNVGQVPARIQALWRQCHRDESLFFLWHRAYVSSMERLMQAAIADPAFRLPYWDWYSDPKLPPIFREEFLDPAKTKHNPLFVRDRNNGVNEGKDIWTPEIVTDFDGNNFNTFQDSLNFSEHGTIHVAVGKRSNMGQTATAARDPIFWLHHANIDRLLPVWLQVNTSAHKPPTSFSGWRSTVYRFPMAPNRTATPTVKQLALGSSEALRYSYESTSRPQVPSPLLPARPIVIAAASGDNQSVRGVRALSSRKRIEIGAATTVELPLESQSARGVHAMGAARRPANAFRSVTIVLDNVAVVDVPEGVLSYRVYLNLPDSTRAPARHSDHFLGTISIFALDHQHDPNAKGQTLRFSATDKISKIMSGTERAPAKLDISIVPVLAPDTAPPQSSVLRIGEIRVEASNLPPK